MHLAIRIGWSFLGFLVGLFASLIAIEAVRLLIEGEATRGGYRPPPPAILIAGVMGAVSGWRTAPSSERVWTMVCAISSGPLRIFRFVRICIASTAIWLMIVAVLVYGFGLFGRYWSSQQWQQFWVVLLGPPMILPIAVILGGWAIGRREERQTAPVQSIGTPRLAETSVASHGSLQNPATPAVCASSSPSARSQGSELPAIRIAPRVIGLLAVGALGLVILGGLTKLLRDRSDSFSVESVGLSGHTSTVTDVAFLNEDRRVVTSSLDGTVRFWDAQSGAETAKLRPPSTLGPNLSWVNSISVLPDSSAIFTVSNAALHIWSTANHSLRRSIPARAMGGVVQLPDSLHRAAISFDGKTIAVGTGSGAIRVFDASTFSEVADLRGHSNEITALAYSLDSQNLASGARDGMVTLWHMGDRTKVRSFKPGGLWIEDLAISPDGKRVAVSSLGGSNMRNRLEIWNLEGKWLGDLENPEGAVARGIVFGSDGNRLFAGTARGSVYVWNLSSLKRIAMLGRHLDGVERAALTADGRRLATSSRDGTVRIWSIPR